MAWLYGDSFDGYQTAQLGSAYDTVSAGVTIDTLHGQCGSQSLKVVQTPSQGYVIKGIASSDPSGIGGMSVYAAAGPYQLCAYFWGLIPIFVMNVAGDGSITGYYNPDAAFPPVSFVTPGALVPLSRLTYVSWDILFGASGTGEVSISIDGVERYTATGLNTAWPGEAQPPTGFQIGGTIQGTKTIYFDSVYLMDRSGPAPWNAQLGHVGASALLATGAGATTDFSVTGAGANWEVSSVNTPDPSTDYISSGTLGATDTYPYTDLPLITDTEVFCVQTRILAKEDAAGSREIDAVVRQGGTDFPSGTPVGVPTTDYGYLIFPMPENPATGAQWLLNDVNGDQFGVTITT